MTKLSFHLNFKKAYSYWMKNVTIGVYLDSFGGANEFQLIVSVNDDDYVVAINEKEALALAPKKSDNPNLNLSDLREDGCFRYPGFILAFSFSRI